MRAACQPGWCDMPRFNPALAAYTLAANQASNARHGSQITDDKVADHFTHVDKKVERTANGHETDSALRCDVELARLALGLKLSPAFRVWVILHDLSRSGQQGFTFQQLLSRCNELNVKNARVYLRKLIRRGAGEFWQHDHRTDTIYPLGYVKLSESLTLKAQRFGLHDLYSTNHVGQRRDMYINVSGAHEDFEAAILEAWYASRNNPTISRFTLCQLFNRDARTIRRLEKRAGIQIVANEVETLDPYDIPLRANGDKRTDVYRTIDARGNTVWHYRLPNTYHAGMVRQHSHKGQARKAAIYTRIALESVELPGNSGQGEQSPGKLKPTGTMYCEDSKAALRSIDRGNTNAVHVPDKPGRGECIVWRVYRTTMYKTI